MEWAILILSVIVIGIIITFSELRIRFVQGELSKREEIIKTLQAENRAREAQFLLINRLPAPNFPQNARPKEEKPLPENVAAPIGRAGINAANRLQLVDLAEQFKKNKEA